MGANISALEKANSASQLRAAVDALPREENYFTKQTRDVLLSKKHLIVDSPIADSVTTFLYSFALPEGKLPLLRTPEIRVLIINVLAPKISGGNPVYHLGGAICNIVQDKLSAELYSTPKSFKAILSCFHRASTAEGARYISGSINNILLHNPASNKLLNTLPVVEAFSALLPLATSDDAARWISNSLDQILHENAEAVKMFGTPTFSEKFRAMEKHASSNDAKDSFKAIADKLLPIMRIRLEQPIRDAKNSQELTAALNSITQQPDFWSSLVDALLSKQHLIQDEESTTSTAKFIKWCCEKNEKLIQRKEIYDLFENVLLPMCLAGTKFIPHVHQALAVIVKNNKDAQEFFSTTSFKEHVVASLPHVDESLLKILNSLLVDNKKALEVFGTPDFKKKFEANFVTNASKEFKNVIKILHDQIVQVRFDTLKKVTDDHNEDIDEEWLKKLAENEKLTRLIQKVKDKNNGVPVHQDPFKLQEFAHLRQQHNDLRKLHQDLVTASSKSIDDLKNQLQNEKTKHAATAADLDGKSKKNDDLEKEMIGLAKNLSDEKQKSSGLEKSVNELSSSIQKLRQELDTVNSQLDQEKQLSRKQKDELQQQEQAFADLKEKLEIGMKELEVEKRRPRIPRVNEGFLTLDRKNTIDAGSTATVYSTTYLGAPVAAKLYHPKIIGDKTIQRELKAAAHLKHPNIVSVISMIEDDRSDRVHGLLLELMGKGLDHYLKLNPQVSLRQRLQWLLEVSQGIFCAHSLGVIHSDIKPENILLSTSNPPIAKLADFGCAKILSTAAPSTMGVRGTASFISPEYLNQVTGATKQSDIFSLGMTIWTVLHTDVKVNPLGQTAEQMNQSVKGNVRPQIASDVPLEIKTLIEKCWNQDPSQRPNIEEVIQVLTQSVQQLEGQKQITFEVSPLWSSEKYLKNKHPSIGLLLNTLKWSPGQDAKTLLFSNDIVDPLHPLFQFVASKFRPTAAVQKRSQYTFPGYQFVRKISRIQFVHPKSNIFLQLHDEDNQSRAANSYLNLQPTFFVAQQQKDALGKLKSFFEDPELSPVDGNSNQSRVLFAWHGTGAENVENVCRDGPRGFRETDAGFFGAGSYFAAEFDYCTKYSTLSGANKNGEFSVILYALSVSQAYPVTLEKDYRKIEDASTHHLHGFSRFYSGDSNTSVALMPRCDCHFIPTKKYYKKHPLGFFQVKERDGSLSKMMSDVAVQLDEQACNELDDEMTGHEIALHSHTRALPIAIVYFK